MPTSITLPVRSVQLDKDLFTLAPAELKQLTDAGLRPQKSHVQLVIHLMIGKPSDDDPATVWASLEDSHVSLGSMMFSKGDHKGWYQHGVDVEMSIDGGLVRISDGPQTANGTASTSSSVSVSLSANTSVGFFGPTPTANAGVGESSSDTHSFSRNLQDFKVINNSDDHTAAHQYRMAACEGKAYSKPTDLWPEQSAVSVVAAVFGSATSLYKPADLATSNLPLVSQCLWQATHTNDVTDTLKLRIRVLHLAAMTRVDRGQNKVLPFHTEVVHVCECDVPMGRLAPGVPVGTLP